MKPEYIKRFEKLGYGMFVHFGLYSMNAHGEWYYLCYKKCDKKYYMSAEFANKFNPKKDWAIKLVKQAKKSGMKYITLTTKHHDGFCLYDTCGLTTWDSMHYGPKRDLVKEFVDACNQEGIVPFFYHAIYDWHREDFNTNFKTYVDYIVKSVEILCKNYGKIGGLWFDGYWAKKDADWEFDRLYQTIRKYQPEAMIINNTGMSDEGRISHHEVDSVTFERGTPNRVASPDGKERAGEMCEVFGCHWGYTKYDFNRKPFKEILSSLVNCRYCNCNFLLNVGPKASGEIASEDKKMLNDLAYWLKRNKWFIYDVKGSDIVGNDCKVLEDEHNYYVLVENVDMASDPNVQMNDHPREVSVPNINVSSGRYLDNNEKVDVASTPNSFFVKPFGYGEALCARVVKIKK